MSATYAGKDSNGAGKYWHSFTDHKASCWGWEVDSEDLGKLTSIRGASYHVPSMEEIESAILESEGC